MPATPRRIEITKRDLEEARARQLGTWIEEAQPFFSDTDTYIRAFALDQLRNLPEPSYLIQALVEHAGFSALTGQPGVGKTFMALDWALSLAHGLPDWAGFALPGKKTKVIYVLAEGFGWAWRRVEAWLEYRNMELDTEHMLMVQEGVNLWPGEGKPQTEARDRLTNTIEAFEPELVVFDTYARTTPGMNENSATETGKVVQYIDQLRLEHNTAVLLLHHPTKAGQSFRGSNAGPGAADVVVHLEEDKHDTVVLEWEKIKNAEHPSKQRFAKLSVAQAMVLDHMGGAKPRVSEKASVRVDFETRWYSGEFEGMSTRKIAEAMEGQVTHTTVSSWIKEIQLDDPEEL